MQNSRDSYSETLDQPALAARMDVGLARINSPSFDKLCRTVATLVETLGRRTSARMNSEDLDA
jgi:hypothetical protein